MGIDEIKIPELGYYFWNGDIKWHVGVEGSRVVVRCVDGGLEAPGERVFVHMPAGNQVIVEPH